MLWDVFISHTSEDKDSVARPLAMELEAAGLRVWFDETQLKVGDSLRAKIDEGLSESRYGVVILSPAFFMKKWPQRELGGLFARGCLLPVWHKLTDQQILEKSPMLLDFVAVSTNVGIAAVADKIIEVAAPYLRPERARGARPYYAEIEFPIECLSRAVEVLESLAEPTTWRFLAINAPGYPEVGWLGSDSRSLVEILHAFASPLIACRALSYKSRRNSALLSTKVRLGLALVEAAVEVFTNEDILAAIPPRIPYSPRVPDWRTKRISDPSRYWWQGLSPDRFDALRAIFLKGPSSPGQEFELISSAEFQEIYESLYSGSCSDSRQRQTLGLLGNGFFGFTSSTRPVLWRVLVCQSRLYQAALAFLGEGMDVAIPNELKRIFHPKRAKLFPYIAPAIAEAQLYEPFATTFSATTAYLDTFVIPRLQSVAVAPLND